MSQSDFDVDEDDQNDSQRTMTASEGSEGESSQNDSQKNTTNQASAPAAPVQTITSPFVYGSIARRLPKPVPICANVVHTHTWTVYFRPYNNEDIAQFVSKVEFKLHESFEQPTRVCERPPYEVTETGWGEFDIAIRVHFIDRPTAGNRPFQLFHYLKLLPRRADGTVSEGTISFEPVVSEQYDEFIFANPSKEMYQALVKAVGTPRRDWIQPNVDWEAIRNKQLSSIRDGKESIREQIEQAKEALDEAKKQHDHYKMVKRNIEKTEKREINKSGLIRAIKQEIEDE